jgi:hypothetical protein
MGVQPGVSVGRFPMTTNSFTKQPKQDHSGSLCQRLLACLMILITSFCCFLRSSYAEGKMSIEKLFKNPPREYRMLQIIHPFPDNPATNPYRLFGQQIETPSTEGAAKQTPSAMLADFLVRDGYGGVVSNVSFDKYLESEEAWKVFLQGVQECRERNLNVWLYDEKGYPSGKAGGLTMRGHPEFECQGVVCAKSEGKILLRHHLPSGERFIGEPISVVAVQIGDEHLDMDHCITLPPETYNGKSDITWKAPDDGDWAIFSFHNRRMYEGTHIVTNLSDSLPYIDIMDHEAVARFIELTHQAYYDRCGNDLWKHIRAIFTDEPSLMTSYLKEEEGLLPAVPWSRGFTEEFKKRNGYDLLPRLPFLFEDCGEETAYVRLDFWRVVSQLIEENYYGQIQDWCQAHGIASSGHALLEEGLQYHTIFEGNLYRDLRRMDVPGIDILSSNPEELAHSQQIPVPKFVSSVAHIIGATHCQSETSCHVERTNNRPCTFAQRMGTINWMYVQGLNYVTSYYSPSEFSDTERKTFNDHIGRLGTMLTGGKHITNLAVYYPIHSMWGACTPTNKIAWHPPITDRERRVNQTFGEASQYLLANQRDFDYLDDQAILDAEIRDGAFILKNESYRCLVLPETWVIPLAVFQKINAFIEAGGALVTVGSLPVLADLKKDTPEVQSLSEKMKKSIRVAVRENTAGMLESVSQFVPADLSLGQPCPELFYCHREQEGKEIYFLANNGGSPVNRNMTFLCDGTVQRWNPSTGEIQPLTGIPADGKTSLDLELQPFEGCFVVFDQKNTLQ